MIRISSEQLAAFQSADIASFTERVRCHVIRFFPECCHELGDTTVKEWIERGSRWASAHGITAERDVCKYIDLVFTFGLEIESHASAILSRNEHLTGAEKIYLLCNVVVSSARRDWGCVTSG